MSAGAKIIEGLEAAARGDFATVYIDGQKWVRQEPTAYDHPYNDGYTHETLHAAHIACDMWDGHVLDTRCADEFPDVKEAIEKASTAMHQVYQLIGQKFKDG